MAHKQSKPGILFVCIGNMIRSQMAEGFARKFGGSFLDVFSAGMAPTGVVAEEAVIVMEEKGIDISRQRSKGLADVPLRDMAYVVSMTGRPAEQICPPGFQGTPVTWNINDPLGRSVDRFRIARDEIEEKVKALIQDIWQRATPKTRRG